MSLFRPSSARLATAVHSSRIPSIHFPTKEERKHHGPPAPHVHAPQSIIDAFPSFLQRLQQSAKSPSSSKSYSPPAGAKALQTGPVGGAANKGFASLNSGPKTDFEGEWVSNFPKRLSRSQYRPSLEEMEAVESGGATIAPTINAAYKQSWYSPAKLNHKRA